MKKKFFVRNFPMVALAAGVITLSSVAQAEMTMIPNQPGVELAKSSAGTGRTHFDWLAKRGANDANTSHRLVRKASLGRGSWICSAAGFGKKSSCYRR